MINRLNVPYTYPPLSFLKLQDYITNLVNQYGGVYWPLDDVANNPYNRVINPAVAVGRELALNGSFSTDTIWGKQTGWTISGGAAHQAAGGNGFLLFQSMPVTQGRAYRITFTVSNFSAGSVRPYVGGTTGTSRTANGTYVEVVLALASATSVGVTTNSASNTYDIDDYSCVELNIPASTATPTQLLNTDVWNGLGVGAWTALNSAILTAQTTTRHDGNSGTVLRVARGVVAPGGATRTVMTVGLVYRVYGWARSDGTCSPVVRHGTTTVFTGTTSTDWQPFDVVFVAASTDIQLNTLNGANTNYVEFDVTVVALDTGIRTDNPTVDKDMELSGVGAWTASNATLTKQGSAHAGANCLRVARVAANGFFALQNVFTIGKSYRIQVYGRSDGSTSPTVGVLSQAANQRTGTTSISWQLFDFYAPAVTSTTLSLGATFASSGYAEFDDITITELSPLVALPVNGVVLGNTESNRLLTSASFDAVNDLINTYSAQLNNIQNWSTFSLGAFAIVSGSGVWTDGTKRVIVRKAIDTNNVAEIYRGTGNNTIVFNLVLGGTTKTVTVAAQSSVGWQHYIMTIDTGADQMKAYINGIQVGSTQTGLGVAVGNLSSTLVVIGANTTAAANLWSGRITQVTDLSATLAIDYISEISKLGDTF